MKQQSSTSSCSNTAKRGHLWLLRDLLIMGVLHDHCSCRLMQFLVPLLHAGHAGIDLPATILLPSPQTHTQHRKLLCTGACTAVQELPRAVTVLPSALPLLLSRLLCFHPDSSIFWFLPVVKPRIHYKYREWVGQVQEKLQLSCKCVSGLGQAW